MPIAGIFQIPAIGKTIAVNIHSWVATHQQRREQILQRITPFRVDFRLQHAVHFKNMVRCLEQISGQVGGSLITKIAVTHYQRGKRVGLQFIE